MIDIDLILEELAEEERQARIDAMYEDFLEEMYYCFQCEQMDEEAEYYNDSIY